MKRNSAKFPAEFMFELTDEEFVGLRSQFVTSNVGRGGRRYEAIADIFAAIRQLMNPPELTKRPIGFVTLSEKKPD